MRAEAEARDDLVEFIATRSESLLRSAWLLTGDRHKAEDLLQTVLAELWVRRGRGGIDSLDAYARRMLYTTCLTWWRRRWRFEVATGDVPDRGHGKDFADDVSRRTVVEHGLARLSRRQRAVLVLRFFEDRSVEATAALLGCSSGAVKTHTSRALAVLRDDDSLRDLIRRGGEQ
jgi:RNA polymerase sigma-70 factor (sigma-E family)